MQEKLEKCFSEDSAEKYQSTWVWLNAGHVLLFSNMYKLGQQSQCHCHPSSSQSLYEFAIQNLYYIMRTNLLNWCNLVSSSKNVVFYAFFSMTSLLTHTVAHSTRPSFRLKTNNQPLKKFLSLAVSWVKVVKNGKILTFKVNFLCQKLSESF